MKRKKFDVKPMTTNDAKFALLTYYEDIIDYVYSGEAEENDVVLVSAIKTLVDNKVL